MKALLMIWPLFQYDFYLVNYLKVDTKNHGFLPEGEINPIERLSYCMKPIKNFF